METDWAKRRRIGMALASLAAMACGLKNDPTPSTQIAPKDVPTPAVRIRLEEIASSCASKDELLKASQEQRKQLFPFTAHDLKDIEITETTQPLFGSGLHPSFLITARKPVAFSAPHDGKFIDSAYTGNRNEGSVFINVLTPSGHKEFQGIEVSGNQSQTNLVSFSKDAEVIFHKKPGDMIKKGDLVFTFKGSPFWNHVGYRRAENSLMLVVLRTTYTPASGGRELADSFVVRALNDVYTLAPDKKLLFCTVDKFLSR